MDREIEIFKAGNYPEHGGEWTNDIVADIVASYDSAVFEAPCVIGHPKDDDPALAWVKRLRATDDGRLHAVIDESTAFPGFLDMIEGGLTEAGGWKPFKKVSAKFYLPDDPYNPHPGHTSLRHVGFLGGAVPAVKGMDTDLRPVSFADDGSTAVGVEVDFVPGRPFKEDKRMTILEKLLAIIPKLSPEGNVTPEFKELFKENFGIEFDEAIKTVETGPKVEPDMPPEFAEKFKELESGYAGKLKAAESRINELEKARKSDVESARKDRINEFVDRVFKAGKVLPSERVVLTSFLETIAPGEVEVAFTEDKKEKIDKLSLGFRFLENALMKKIEFDELTGEGVLSESGGDPYAQKGMEIAKLASSFTEKSGSLDDLAKLIAEKLAK